MCAALMAGTVAHAATLYWDNDTLGTGNDVSGTGLGGTGTWDTTTLKWWPGTGTTDQPWSNAGNDTAGFVGTAGTVTLGVPITVGALDFETSGFTLTGTVGNPLTFAGATPTITFGASATTATISGVIAGTAGVTTTGAGVLTLSGTNTLTGGLNITGGSTVSVNLDSQLGGASNSLTLDGGTLRQSGNTTVTLGAARTITVNAGGGTIDVTLANPGKLLLNTAGQILGAGNLTKTGAGILQLAQANNGFSGGWTFGAGPTEVQNVSALGVGASTLSVTGSGELVASNIIISRNLSLVGGTISSDNGNASAFTGAISVGGTAFNVGVRDFYSTGVARTLTISGLLTGSGQMNLLGSTTTNNNGTLFLNTANLVLGSTYSGTINVGANAILGLGNDGNGLGDRQTMTVGTVLNTITFAAGNAGYAVGRLGTGATLNQALNKTIRITALPNNSTNSLLLTPTSGYGLDLSGDIALTATQTYNVGGTQASNVVPGLTLSGILSGAQNIVKTGTGTLVLGNDSNTFGTGLATTIEVQGGVIAVATDGALGATGNGVRLNGTAATFRATGSFPLASTRTITLTGTTATNNVIEVSSGSVFTVSSAFGLGAATNGMVKGENGILVLAANNPTWTGTATVNAGAIRITNGGALGTAAGNTTVANSIDAAVQIDGTAGGLTVVEPFNLSSSGINTGGSLENISGTNTNIVSGAITLGNDATIGSTSGTLSLTGGITGAKNLTLAGAGNITIGTTALGAVTTATKIGSGTATLTAASTAFVGNLAVSAGTFAMSGAGIIGGTGTLAINPGAIISLDNSGTSTNSRLGGRVTTSLGGTLNIAGHATAVTSETLGNITFGRGNTLVNATLPVGTTTGRMNVVLGVPTRSGAGTALFRGTNLGSAAGDGNATIAATGAGFTFTGAGAAATTNKGLLPWAIIDTTAAGNGVSFATADTATSILRPLAGTEVSTANALTAATTGLNAAPSGTFGFTIGFANTVNSLTLGSGAGVDLGTAPYTLTVGPGTAAGLGGVLATSGNTNITGGILTAGLGELIVHSVADLSISSTITGGSGGSTFAFTKSGAGMLTLTAPNFFTGQTVVNQGTLKLAGGTNTLFFNNYMHLGAGATLDITGTSQYLQDLFSDGAVANGGGMVTGNAASTLVLNRDNSARNFAGNFTGGLSLVRSGLSTWTLYSNSDFTGTTLINGGVTVLKDAARFSGSETINIQYGTLSLDNSGTMDVADRIKPTATVTLRGGVFNYTGRAQTASSETINSLVLDQGSSNITVTAGATGINSADLIFNTLVQQNNATLNLNNVSGLIGSNARLRFTTAPTLTNGILPYVVHTGVDLVTNIPGLGLAPLNAAGGPQYDSTTAFPAAGGATQNIKLSAASFTVPDVAGVGTAGTYPLNALVYVPSATQSIGFADSLDTLNLTAGALVKSGNFAATLGSVLDNGRLTAGGATFTGATVPLYLQQNSGTLTINSRIVDNPNGDAVRLVHTSYNGGNLILANGSNSYSGGTVVNGGAGFTGTLTIGATGKLPGGGLTINQATVTQAAGGVIDSTNAVTLNGSSTLTLTGANTLAQLTINNIGGGTAPTVTTGGTLSLTNATPTTVTSSNVAVTAAINGTLDFGGVAKTFLIEAISANSSNLAPWAETVNIGAVIQNSGLITKNGGGVLRLNAASTFGGGLTVATGGLMVGGSSSPATFGAGVNTGPVGSGTLTMAASTTLLSTGANTLANPVVFQGDVAFNGLQPLTLIGGITLPGTSTVTVAAPTANLTLGAVGGTGLTINKAGPGILTFGNPSTLTGNINLNNGTLALAGTGGPAGTATINYNGGQLNFRSGLTVANGVVNYGNNVVVNPALTQALFDVGNGAVSSSVVSMGNLTTQPTTLINVTNSSGTALAYVRFSGTNLPTAFPTTPAPFNIGTNAGLILPGGFNDTNRPTNSGPGTLIFSGNNTFTAAISIPAATTTTLSPTANSTTTPLGTGDIALSGTLALTPLPGTLSNLTGGYVSGGFNARFYSYGGTPSLSAATGNTIAGIAPFAVVNGALLGDAQIRNSPPGLSPGGPNSNTASVYSGLLNITTGGTYTFSAAADDAEQLVIDGTLVQSSATGGIALATTVPVSLTPGLHSIVYKALNSGSAGNYQLFYGGPDTVGKGTPGITGTTVIPLPASALFYQPGLASFGNTATLGNKVVVTGNAAVLDGLGSDFNLGVGSMTLNDGAVLTVNNVGAAAGTGIIGVVGSTNSTATATAPTLTPASGLLYLAGGYDDSTATVKGLIKAGTGTLLLGPSTTFTGPFNIKSGSVVLTSPTALTTGTTTVGDTVGATVASLDLNGQTGVKGAIVLNGSGVSVGNNTSNTQGALYNSSPSTATIDSTATVSINAQISGSSPRISGNGDIVINGVVQDGTTTGGVFVKNGYNTLTLSGTNTFTGPLVVILGVLKLNNASALGAASTNAIASGAALDLNGQALGAGETFTTAVGGTTGITGVGPTGLGINNTLGAVINSNSSGASLAGPIVLSGGTSIGGPSLAPGVNGDITLSGVISGAQTLTKVGANNLILTNAANTFNGFTVNQGSLVMNAGGSFAAGTTTNTVSNGATILLDSTGTAVSNRLGARGLFLNGNLTIKGHATTAVTEAITSPGNNFNVNQGAVLTLDATAGAAVTVSVASTSTTLFTRPAAGAGTILIRGTNLGNTAGAGVTNLTLGGSGAINNNFVGQLGAAATVNRGVIPYAIIDQSASGVGTDFASYNAANGIAALAGTEQAAALPTSTTLTGVTNSTTTVNVTSAAGLAAGQSVTGVGIAANTTIASIAGNVVTLSGNASLTGTNNLTFGTIPNLSLTSSVAAGAGTTFINSLKLGASSSLAIGTGNSLQVDSGGLLAVGGGALSITGGGTLAGGISAGTQFAPTAFREIIAHVVAGTSLDIAPTLFSTVGLTKADGGTLTLSAQETYFGTTTINGGILKLNSGGTNTIFQPFSTAPAVNSTGAGVAAQIFQINFGGTLDLNGLSQSASNFNSASGVAGLGGTVINSNATNGNFHIAPNGNQTWSGDIGGPTVGSQNVNFIRDGNSTFFLNSANNYTGITTIIGGATALVDQGSILNTSAINIARAVLRWDDTGIQPLASRLSTTAIITLDGGALVYSPRAGVNTNYSLPNTVVLNSGASFIGLNANSNQSTLTLAALPTRNAGTTLTFGGTGGVGENPRVFFTSAPTLSNGIVAPWLIVQGPDNAGSNLSFATYESGSGVHQLELFTNVIAAGNNVRLTGNLTLPVGSNTINTLTLAAATLSFVNATDTLTIQAGGILGGADNNGRAIGSTAIPGQITTGAGQQELFIYNAGNTLTINSKIINNASPVSLVLSGAAQTGNTPTITLTGANTYTGTTYVNGLVANLNTTGANGTTITAIPGDLILNGGNNNGADSIAIGNARVTLSQSSQLSNTATVTINGGAQFDLNNNNQTLANLTINSDGGTNSATGPAVTTGGGVLKVTGTITAQNLLSTFDVPSINGTLDLNGGATTVLVNPVIYAPGQIGLAINAAMTNGPLVKTGSGVLAIGAQNPGALAVNVNGGTLTLNTTNAVIGGQVTLAGGTTLDARGIVGGTIGSLAGTGSLTNFNQTTPGTIVVGLDGGAATFDGVISSPFASGQLNVTKIGGGVQNFTANSATTNSGTLTVQAGTVGLTGASAKLGFSTVLINEGGTITVDNVTSTANDRLGGASLANSVATIASPGPIRALTIQGGALNLSTGGTAATENLGDVTIGAGTSTLNVDPGTGGYTITVNRLINSNNGGVLKLAGPGALGTTAAGSGIVNLKVNNTSVAGTVISSTLGALGVGNIGLVGGGGNTVGLSIRPDVVAVDGTGKTGFVTYDTNGFRLLATAEYSAFPVEPNLAPYAALAPATNVLVTNNQYITTNTTLNGLRLDAGGGVTASGGGLAGLSAPSVVLAPLTAIQDYNGLGAISQVIVNTGTVISNSGNLGINGGVILAPNNIPLSFDVAGDLTVNAFINTYTGNSLVKDLDGTLTLARGSFQTGATSVNAGVLALGSGRANTLLVQMGGSTPTLTTLNANGGALDLSGQDQTVGTFTSSDPLPGTGGNVISSSGTPNFTISSTTGGTFSGSIGNAINLYKANTSTEILTSSNGFTGSTNVVGGNLTLRDSGALTGTSAINLNFATLQLDNTGLTDNTARVTTSVPVTFKGGTLSINGRQGVNDTETINTIFDSGANTVAVASGLGNGSFALTTLSNPTVAAFHPSNATVNFTPNSVGTLGNLGPNPRVFFGGGYTTSNLVNNIVAGWATVNGTDLTTYTATGGVTNMGNGSISGTPGYSGNAINAATATDNVNTSSTTAAVTTQSVTTRTANAWRIANTFGATNVTMNSTADTLTLATGGLLVAGTNTQSVTIQGGKLTAGTTAGAALYAHIYGSQTPTINSLITNNAAGAVSLVKAGSAGLILNPLLGLTGSGTAAATTFTVPSATGLSIGQVVSGTSITAGTTITGIAGTTITISNALGGTGAQTLSLNFLPQVTSSTLVAGNTAVTVAAGTNIANGQTVLGVGIPAGTTVVSGGGTTALVLSNAPTVTGVANLSYAPAGTAASNTYTGGTFIQTSNVNLSGNPGSTVIPGDLTIYNGATVTMVTNAGQIAPTSNLTIVGGGTMTMVGLANTLASVTFNNNGGTTAPTLNVVAGDVLLLTGGIAASSDNAASTSTISNGTLTFSAAPTINVTTNTAGRGAVDLQIGSVISNTNPNGNVAPGWTSAGTPLIKSGNGALNLFGASTFSNGVNLTGGTLVFGAATTPSTVGTPVTSGPLGTGTLTISGGTTTTIQGDGTARAIGNPIAVASDFTFGGTFSGHNLTLNGSVSLGAAQRTLTVLNPFVTATIGGQITGSGGGLTKAGDGILVLSNSGNAYTGPTVLNAGELRAGAANALPLNTALMVKSNSAFDLNAFDVSIGTLAGEDATHGGLVTNSGAAKTLTIGNGGGSATFAGLLTQGATSNALNLTKIGAGTQTLVNGTNNATGTLTVQQGNVTLSGGGAVLFGTDTLNGGGVLTLDNTTTNVANRLGGNTRNVTLAGGTLNVLANGTAALSENINALTVNSGTGTINITPGGANTTNILNAVSYAYTAANGGTLFLNGAGLGTTTGSATTANLIVTGTAPTLTNGIRPEIVGTDGTNTGFVTYTAGQGFRVLTTADYGAFPAQPVAGPFTAVTLNNNVAAATSLTFTTNTATNSLTLSTGGSTSSMGATLASHNYNALGGLNTLTLTSGALVANSNNGGINGGALAAAGSLPLIVHAFADLNINANLTGSGGLVKAESGKLTLSQPSYNTGATFVNGGNLTLGSGAANTLLVQPTATVVTVAALNVNNGGTLNLNGQDQAVGAISNNDPIGTTGGTITSTGAANLFSSSTTSTTYAGDIGGALSFYKANTSTLTITAPLTYTGTTNIQGGGLTLKDSATLGSSAVNLNAATLALDNSGLAVVGNRAGSAGITSRSGSLTYTGRAGGVQDPVSVTALTLDSGSTILGNTATNPVALTVGTFSRNAANGATLMLFPFTNLGRLGSANTNIQFTSGAPAVVNNILGGWATVNGSEWLTYSATANTAGGIGLGTLGDTASGFANYDFTGANVFTGYTPSASANVKITGQTTALLPVPVVSGTFVANSINLVSSAAAGGLSFTAGTDTLNLTSGGILHSGNFTAAIGSSAGNGQITAGGATPAGAQDLFVYNNQSTLTINSKILDNGASKVRLIVSGYAPNNATVQLSAANTYTGGTVVSGTGTGKLELLGAAGTVVIPAGGVTLNNSNVTMTTNGGQIEATNDITLNASSVLTLAGSNTLNSLIFNNNGGTTQPEVKTATALTLTSAAPITATNDNLGTTPTVSGTALLLTNAAGATINVSGLSPEGLAITAPITSVPGTGGVTKIGTGSLILNAANTFTAAAGAGVKLQDGALILNTTAALGNAANTLTIGDATTANTVPLTLFAGSAAVTTAANPVVVNRDFTFGGTASTNNLSLGGTVNFGTAIRTITVSSPQVTGTLSGQVTSGAGSGLIKAGPGILTLSGATNNYTGNTLVSAGILKLGNVAAIPTTSNTTVNPGAVLDINGVGGVLLTLAGNGLVTNSGAAATLVIGGTSATDVTTASNSSFPGLITNGTNALNLQKVGTGTLTLTAADSYTGSTNISKGTLTFGVDQTLSAATNTLVFGSAAGNANLGNFDLTAANGTFGGALIVQTNSATANTISIGSGKTLNVAGLTMGYDAGSGTGTTQSKLTVTGPGALSITGTTINVSVNQAAVNAAYFSTATLDLSGLGSSSTGFSTNVTTFNIGVGSTTTGVGNVILSNVANNILATTLTVGDSGANNGNGTSTLTLGTGTNNIQADTINIGRGKGSSAGVVQFASQTAGSPGTVTITNKAGNGAANITIANGNTTATAGGAVGTLDLRGHVATVTAGTVLIGNANAGSNISGVSGTLNFDTGTFSVNTLSMGIKTAGSTGSAVAALNVSGGAFTVNTAFTLGSQATAGTASATLTLTGGTFTSFADILDGGGATTSTITLNGATAILDLKGKSIGGATPVDAFNLQAGTLQNLGEFNAGATALSKTTGGTVTLAGTNSYTGPTNVTAGTLLINALQGSATGAVTVSSGATLGGTGVIGGSTTVQTGGNLKPGTSAGLLTFNNNLTLGGDTTSSTFEIQGTARGTVGGYDAINLGASSLLTYDGVLTLDISGTITDGTYDLFAFTAAPTGSFDQVTLFGSGGYTGNLTNNSGVWTGSSQNTNFTFTQATGDLLVATVPEPGALVSLLGGLGILLGFRRSRRPR
ncbi:MAG: hypothetical protein QOE70_746 [Chthoniobacter sp.]|jgi:autotransporter-associated beta strand protein|nr:hypothetical protein [Chthoniobacter sp.]